jgi:predicted nucleic acid-binding protein
MRLLLDTNIFLEVLLSQSRADEAKALLSETERFAMFVSDYSLHSIGTILFRRNMHAVFWGFIEDVLTNAGFAEVSLQPAELGLVVESAVKWRMDFDDAYQVSAAKKFGLAIVSFDTDFDKCDIGRKTPLELLQA